MDTIIIERQYLEDRTLGDLYIVSDGKKTPIGKTLELPYQGNRKFVSCIPEGEYYASKEINPKLGIIIRLYVEGRTGILIHKGNFITETTGCILIGKTYNITEKKLSKSNKAMEYLFSLISSQIKIIISEKLDH